MKIKIHVTDEIIKASYRCEGAIYTEDEFNKLEGVVFNCAISLAVRDIFPKAWVDSKEIRLGDSYFNTSRKLCDLIPLPEEAVDFIIEFDSFTPSQRLTMLPISFDVDVPDSVIEKIGITEAQEIIKNSKTLELV